MTEYRELINTPIIDKIKLRIPATPHNVDLFQNLQDNYSIFWNVYHYSGYLFKLSDGTKQGILSYSNSDFDNSYYLTFNPAKLSTKQKRELESILLLLEQKQLFKIDLAFDCRFDLATDTYIYNNTIHTNGSFTSTSKTTYIGNSNKSNRALTIYDKNREQKRNTSDILHRLEIHLNKKYAKEFLTLEPQDILKGFNIKKLNLNQPIKKYNKLVPLTYMEKVAIYDYLTNSSGLKSTATQSEKRAIARLVTKVQQIDLITDFESVLTDNLAEIKEEVSRFTYNTEIEIQLGVA